MVYNMVAAPGHGYISVSAAAFQPKSHTYRYDIDSISIFNVDGNSDYYYAPLELPQGATVTRLIFYWEDGSSADGYCSMWRSAMMGSYGLGMATANTSGDTGVADSSEDTSIDSATVDNSQYSYGLTVYLPDSGVEAFGVVVEYVYSVSLPLVGHNF